MFQNPKIVLSPTYAYLQQEIRKIPAGDYRILETYCDRRNMVRKIELTGGRIFVLKQYKRPTRLNQFAYTLFRKSKACRAYEYALRLQQLGFETAAPVAYLEISRHGLFHTGYFLSEFIAHPLLSTLQEGDEESRKILEDFAAFIVEMHEKGVFNLDMNPGNVFFYKSGEKYRFALIDINRIRFCRHLTRNDCVEVFKHLDNLPPPALSVVLVRYAELRQGIPRFSAEPLCCDKGSTCPAASKRVSDPCYRIWACENNPTPYPEIPGL